MPNRRSEEFEVWEALFAPTGHPSSTWTRYMAGYLETGVHLLPDGRWLRADDGQTGAF